MANVLLVGQGPEQSDLSNHLREKGCDCSFASTYRQASAMLRADRFDIVLGAIRLNDGSGLALSDALEGSGVTLFYSYPVEQGCWWLPALRHGQKVFGTPALRPGEFVAALNEIISQTRSSRIVTHSAQQIPAEKALAAATSSHRTPRKIEPPPPAQSKLAG